MGEQALRILLVGSRGDLHLLAGLLQRAMGPGASRLDHTPSLAQALKRLTSTAYDLLFLDERVQGRPGVEMVAELRRAQSSLPIVFLTGHPGEELGQQAMRNGANDYLEKESLNEFRLSRTIRCALCQRKRESRCRDAEARLRKLSRAVEQSADLVTITDREGRIEYVNPAFEKLTGFAQQEVLGRTAALLKSGEHTPQFYRELWQTILSGRVFRGVLVNKKKDGQLFHTEKTISPVRDAAGVITHFISNDRDITERRKLEAELLQAQKMDAVGRLAGGVAHDFNNLLMVISSYAELALDSLSAEHPLRRHLQEIFAASRRATELTRQLLAFGRKQMQCLRLLDLNALLQELSKMLPRLIGEDIELALVLGKKLGAIKADPIQMEQVILNLAANARDAMPNGGHLRIETANVHLDQPYVHKRPIVPIGDYVLLTVTDSGTGIAPDHLPHLFEPFFTTKEKGQGTGLGLATVYGIVKQSSGFIWVYSEVGLGTTFKIYLPRRVAVTRNRASDTRTDLEELPKGSETLLVVEDEEAVRRPACEFLSSCGYQVLDAREGREAIQVARAFHGPIHLMITDVVMPQMSGTQVAEQLSRERPGLKVMYISGYASPILLQHGLCAGQRLVLEKPFGLKVLAAKVRDALDRPAPAPTS